MIAATQTSDDIDEVFKTSAINESLIPGPLIQALKADDEEDSSKAPEREIPQFLSVVQPCDSAVELGVADKCAKEEIFEIPEACDETDTNKAAEQEILQSLPVIHPLLSIVVISFKYECEVPPPCLTEIVETEGIDVVNAREDDQQQEVGCSLPCKTKKPCASVAVKKALLALDAVKRLIEKIRRMVFYTLFCC